MRKSTRALVGLMGLDALIAAGTAWFVMDIKRGAALTVPPAEAITTVTTIGGGAIGIITAILLVAFFVHRSEGIKARRRDYAQTKADYLRATIASASEATDSLDCLSGI